MKKGMIVLLTVLCALGFSGCGNQTTAEQSSSAETVVTTTDAPVTTTAATTTTDAPTTTTSTTATTATKDAPKANLDKTETIDGLSFLCDSSWEHKVNEENSSCHYWYQSDGGLIMLSTVQLGINVPDLSGEEKQTFIKESFSGFYSGLISKYEKYSDYDNIEIDGQPAIKFEGTMIGCSSNVFAIICNDYLYCIQFTNNMFGKKTILSDYIDEIIDSIELSPATTESTTVTTEQPEPTTTVATTLPPATEAPTQAPTIAPDANSSGRTVIITENGKKYHKKVHGDWTVIGEIPESQAVAQGYEPCKTCYK